MNKYFKEQATVETLTTEPLSFVDGVEYATSEALLDKSISDCGNLLSAYSIGCSPEDSATAEALSLMLTAPVSTVYAFTSLESASFLQKAIQAVKNTITKLIDWVKKVYSKIFNKKAEEIKTNLKKTGPVKIKVSKAVTEPVKDVKKLSETERAIAINGEEIVLDTTIMKDKAVLSQIHFVSAFKIALSKGYMIHNVDEKSYYTIDFEGEDKIFSKDEIDKEISSEYESSTSMIDEYLKWRYKFEEYISNLQKVLQNSVEKETDEKKATKAMHKINGFIKQYRGALRNIERVLDFEMKLTQLSLDNIK